MGHTPSKKLPERLCSPLFLLHISHPYIERALTHRKFSSECAHDLRPPPPPPPLSSFLPSLFRIVQCSPSSHTHWVPSLQHSVDAYYARIFQQFQAHIVVCRSNQFLPRPNHWHACGEPALSTCLHQQRPLLACTVRSQLASSCAFAVYVCVMGAAGQECE